MTTETDDGCPDAATASDPVQAEPSLSTRAASHQAQTDAATVVSIDGAESVNKWVVLVLVGTATFMTTLDGSIVNIGLPSIARSFGTPLSGSIEWIIDGYLVVTAALLLTFGRLADMLGRMPVFLAGVLVFTLGSALCGAAPSLGVLIAARCFQGIGGAAIFAANTAMITRAFPASERGRALGTNAILLAMGFTLGPTIGGILTQIGTWRWIFYVNVPIGVIVSLGARRLLAERRPHAGTGRERQTFDLAGAAFLAVGLGALTLGLSFGQEWGWHSLRFIAAIVIALVALASAVWVERRISAPLVDLALLRNRAFACANISVMMSILAAFAVGLLLPFYFEELRGYSTIDSGLLLTPYALTVAVVAPLSGRLADRVRSAWLAPVGLAIACGGVLLLSGLTQASSTVYLIVFLVVAGMGQALFMSPNARALMGAAPMQQQGVASGAYATARAMGQSLSVAVAGAVFASFGAAAAGAALEAGQQSMSVQQAQALQHTFVAGLHAAYVVCAALAAVGVVAALIRDKETS